ncbi:MAG: MBL fold metallo-hydrolase [Puniceicoccales bacterium]|jgi:glyoxylase-like metal-dependent hydrolase (beta-lactamase superfamily II)|nr:MBL fold metallo-hydrolase [Puniceicoccales bacterium]
MKIERATLGPYETNAYVLWDETTRRCAIVDAPPEAAAVLLPEIRRRALTLEALLLTHGHWDHMCDAGALAAAVPGLAVFANRDDAAQYAHPEQFAPWYMAGMPELTEDAFKPVEVTRWLTDGDTFEVIGSTFEARHVPGHCPGNLLFYCATEKVAFPGDVIFRESVGRTDLPGGDWATLRASVRNRVFTLPAETVLLPGHGPATSVEHEIANNPHVRP